MGCARATASSSIPIQNSFATISLDSCRRKMTAICDDCVCKSAVMAFLWLWDRYGRDLQMWCEASHNRCDCPLSPSPPATRTFAWFRQLKRSWLNNGETQGAPWQNAAVDVVSRSLSASFGSRALVGSLPITRLIDDADRLIRAGRKILRLVFVTERERNLGPLCWLS